MASVGYNTVRYNELGKSEFVNPKLETLWEEPMLDAPPGGVDVAPWDGVRVSSD